MKANSSNGLEILKLQNALASMKAELRSIKSELNVSSEPLPEKVQRLRLEIIKIKRSIQLTPMPEDRYRLQALETELGRSLLCLDGIL